MSFPWVVGVAVLAWAGTGVALAVYIVLQGIFLRVRLSRHEWEPIHLHDTLVLIVGGMVAGPLLWKWWFEEWRHGR